MEYNFCKTYLRQIKSPAVCQVHLDEAVELLAHPLQTDQMLQWQITKYVWNKHIFPGQIEQMTYAGKMQTEAFTTGP